MNTDPMSRERAAAWLAAMESGKLNVPSDIHDAEAWDRYWVAHLEVGPMELGFSDMMSNDPGLVPELDRRSVRTILCAGNGFSSESWALALHGFDVSVLDTSSLPRWHLQNQLADSESGLRGIAGVVPRGEASVAFDAAVPIDSDQWPSMHRAEGRSLRGGGSLTYFTGDLIAAEHCPGPFDVVIERRTVQLFPESERPAALDRLAARLTPQGLLISHQHRGAWKPPEPRTHFAEQWMSDRGFNHYSRETVDSQRTARLILTTG
jgi:hypothetical protein